MVKTLNGSALISYGPALPVTASVSDGALFYKTDASGGNPQGLYMYGFVKDINPGTLGFQVAQTWVQVVSPDLFVAKAGDVMTGSLTVPNVFKVTASTGVQRILIGNQDSSGTNKPAIVQGSNGDITIGFGTDWSTGGTLTASLGLAASLGATGITWQGNQVWHAGKMGAGSGLDADKLDGQDSTYYLNASNMSSGVLPVSRGGTGQNVTVTGGIVYGTSATAYSTSLAGTTGQVLTSNGAATPTWVSQSALSVGSATTANSANSATFATTAGNAATATNMAWTGLTGLNPAVPAASTSVLSLSAYPAAGFTAYARPSYFFDMGGTGSASMTPPQFPVSSISGFDSYFTSDIGSYQVGLTVMGTLGNGGRAMQLAANWNFEELSPQGLRFRVNDDTGTVGAWGAWQTLWDQGNLVNVSQLTNDAGYFAQKGIALQLGGSATAANNLVWNVPSTPNGTIKLSRGNIGSTTSDVLTIDASSNLVVTGNVTAYSDIRLKSDVRLITDALSKLGTLHGVTFARRSDGARGTGLIAQDVAKVLPEAVVEDADGMLSVAYGNLVGLLVQAVKELQAEVEELKRYSVSKLK